MRFLFPQNESLGIMPIHPNPAFPNNHSTVQVAYSRIIDAIVLTGLFYAWSLFDGWTGRKLNHVNSRCNPSD